MLLSTGLDAHHLRRSQVKTAITVEKNCFQKSTTIHLSTSMELPGDATTAASRPSPNREKQRVLGLKDRSWIFRQEGTGFKQPAFFSQGR